MKGPTGSYRTVRPHRGAFIVWRKFQRRVEVLAPLLDLEIWYFHYEWEERSKGLKVLSYFPKSIRTLRSLFQKRPPLVFVQFPPTPVLYCVAFYSWLTGSRYVSDCHLELINDGWLEWVYAQKLLSKAIMVVHNEHIARHVLRSTNLAPIVLRDGVAETQSAIVGGSTLLERLGLSPKSYLIVPCSFSSDEPIEQIVEAAILLPDIIFVLTWYSERLSTTIRDHLPRNVLLTGYLPNDDFNYLFANSGVALVLTKQEAIQLSGMQEAMAFAIPAVVSDLSTTRFLYRDYPIYVENEPESIALGVRYAFHNRAGLEKRMRSLRIEAEREFCVQLAHLRTSLEL